MKSKRILSILSAQMAAGATVKIAAAVLVSTVVLVSTPAFAAQLNPAMQTLADKYKKDAGVKSFSAEEGKKLYASRRTHSANREERSCTTCHTANPAAEGKTPVGKVIEPLSPAANKERFTDPKKVEKWFKRNCEWVLERECTPKEKGDFITYMMSL